MAFSVSVVIPTYNYGQFIAEAIDSVLQQTCPVDEIIIVDDGSTDETRAVVEAFGDRVRYIKQENAGVCAARNRGVAETSGEVIAFLDADDIWEANKVEKQLAAFVEDPEVALVHCGMREFDSRTGETLRLFLEGGEGWVAKEMAKWEKHIIGPSSTLMVKREVFDVVGNFDTQLKNGEDWEFCFRVAYKYKIGVVLAPLLNYRNHGINATKNVAEMERSTLIAWEKVFKTDDQSIRRLRRRSYGNLHKVLAGSYLHQGEMSGFFRNVLKSLWYRPTYIGFYLSRLARRKKRQAG
jgi:glycosyltransferase involved in cell wall biosynthesis